MIGDIIKEQRLALNMSRKTLAEGICTEKYVYLIETKKRNPSTYILNSFSERMGIDLFEYYQLLSYKDKSAVADYKERFERYIQLGNLEKLREVSLEAAKLADFQVEPLSYDIVIIELVHRGLVLGETSQVIKELNDVFKQDKLNIDNITLINGHVLLASCYQMEGQLDQAAEVLKVAYDMIKDKGEFARYNTVIITVLISIASLLHNTEEYDELIQYSNVLRGFQEKYSEYNRIYYVDFYLAIAYYKTNELAQAKEHFEKGLYAALLFKSKLDTSYILMMEGFSEVADKLEINQYLLDQLYEILD